jgi:hypothetical protein
MLESPGISKHHHLSTYSLPIALSAASILNSWTCKLSVDGLWRWWFSCIFIKKNPHSSPTLLATTWSTEHNIVTKEHVKVFQWLASACRIGGEQLKLIILCYNQPQRWCYLFPWNLTGRLAFCCLYYAEIVNIMPNSNFHSTKRFGYLDY